MTQFNDQIEEIAQFAKSNGFDPTTQFDALIKAWVKMTYERSIWIQINKKEAINTIKKYI